VGLLKRQIGLIGEHVDVCVMVSHQVRQEGCDMAQAVSGRPLTAEARLCDLFSLRGICGGQSGTGTGFFPSSSDFPTSLSFHRDSPL
jgi:hypothetical protein